MRYCVLLSVPLPPACDTIADAVFVPDRSRPPASRTPPASAPPCPAHLQTAASSVVLVRFVSHRPIDPFRPRRSLSGDYVAHWQTRTGAHSTDHTATGRAPDR